MKKRLLLIILVTALSLTLTTNSTWAGNTRHNRMKGIAIGLGAAIIGSIILSDIKQKDYRYQEICSVKPRHNKGSKYRNGYWGIKKKWVPPTYKRVWIPGNYNSRGGWVKARWVKKVVKPGYWTRKRVWVASKKPGRRYGR